MKSFRSFSKATISIKLTKKTEKFYLLNYSVLSSVFLLYLSFFFRCSKQKVNPLKIPSKRQTDRQIEQGNREREREKALLNNIKCCIIWNIKYSFVSCACMCLGVQVRACVFACMRARAQTSVVPFLYLSNYSG